MKTKSKIQIVKDFKEKSILISREFDAPVKNVWNAFTQSKILDQWWGPSPWRAETKSMNFTPNGFWLYAMIGPQGEKHWGRMNYLAIDDQKSFDLEDVFCDENGNINKELPVSTGQMVFTPIQNGTRVNFKMVYPSESDLRKIIEMGFEQGITICLDQLENLFEQKKI